MGKEVEAGPQAAALFDLDGVIFDTESQYSQFWGEKGRQYHPETEHFEQQIKGQTLKQIFDRWFKGQEGTQREIAAGLDDFERRMAYEYVPGVEDFVRALREAGVRTAVVTSSNEAKMNNVYRQHPRFREAFDRIFTAECFARSKPAPDCYLAGAEAFGLPADRCVAFEDSFNGLAAGRAAGMKVVGLATTNTAEQIAGLCDVAIPDFRTFGVKKMLELLDVNG